MQQTSSMGIAWSIAWVSIGKDFERDTNCTIRGKVANAKAILLPQKQLVDYAVQWLESNRIEGGMENE